MYASKQTGYTAIPFLPEDPFQGGTQVTYSMYEKTLTARNTLLYLPEISFAKPAKCTSRREMRDHARTIMANARQIWRNIAQLMTKKWAAECTKEVNDTTRNLLDIRRWQQSICGVDNDSNWYKNAHRYVTCGICPCQWNDKFQEHQFHRLHFPAKIKVNYKTYLHPTLNAGVLQN